MRVLIINSVCGIRSTGRICANLAVELENKGNEVRIAYGREEVPEQYQHFAVKISSKWDNTLHGIYSRIWDRHGFASKRATKKFLKWADAFNPDLVWLHNIHGYYINIELLFRWVKSRPNMQVKWTLHDCWAFTGHCSYFTMAKCDKWKKHCGNCPQKNKYPKSLIFDNSKKNYESKKTLFCGVKDMTLITPSKWLADLVKESFLREYPVDVIYNKIDLNVFHPASSRFRERYELKNKKIVLGVASVWDERKGFKDFLQLRTLLNAVYTIVLVGLNEDQLKNLPNGIIGIKRTNSEKELAEIYSAADIFVNPTYEDNFPTVNLEAQACGAHVITYDTGGCRETIGDSGELISTGDVVEIEKAILKYIEHNEEWS